MDAKILIQGAGVCVAAFALMHFLPVDQLLKPSPPDVTMGPLTSRVDVTFQKVKGEDQRPMAERIAESIERDIKMAEVAAKIEGIAVRPEAEMRAAVDDAPKSEAYVGYGTLAKLTVPVMEANDLDTTGMKVACFSVRDPGFDEETPPSSRHQIILYDAKRYVPAHSASLFTWVYSGCAEAVRASPNISMTRYKTTLRDMLPVTPEYDKARRDIMQSLNSNAKQTGA
jgi:hypothetical protein